MLRDTLGRRSGSKPAINKFMLEIRRFLTVGAAMF